MKPATWSLLYRFVLGPLIAAGARIGSLVSPKIRRGLAGRRRQIPALVSSPDDRRFAIHVHAASVGEFEQAKPIIEELRRERRAYRITASFFSPSGFEQQGAYGSIDSAWYLPNDRAEDVARFLDAIEPDLVIVIRYDLWPEFIRAAHERRIPIALVCATLRDGAPQLRPIVRGFFQWVYGMVDVVACVSDADAAAFAELGVAAHVEVAGDTRYDRVVERADAGKYAGLPIARRQLGSGIVLVAGSTWPPDEELLVPLAGDASLRLVIVPHEPTASHVEALRSKLDRAMLLSELASGAELTPGAALIVDRTGILLGLYALADVAYVGGAFGAGVHSVLEPAAYGVPVITGPRVGRSRDATQMLESGLLELVTTAEGLREAVGRFASDRDLRERAGRAAGEFVRARAGATERILASLRRHRLLPEDAG